MTTSSEAARQRADYVRALNEELDMCQRLGQTDRVEDIKVELERVGGTVADRQAPPSSTVAAPSDPTAEKREKAAQEAADAAAAQRAQTEGQPAAKKAAPAKKAAAPKKRAPRRRS